jgi:hypothetical protein
VKELELQESGQQKSARNIYISYGFPDEFFHILPAAYIQKEFLRSYNDKYYM